MEAKDKRSLLRFTKVPVLSQFSHRFFEWVKASQLEATTKQYYEYGWNMLQKTRIPGMPLDQITRDMAEMLRFHGSAANGNARCGRFGGCSVRRPNEEFFRLRPGSSC
jgi:hypothetical protein